MSEDKTRRPRIVKGQLVRSTNPVQNDCAMSLVVYHYYNKLTNKRIRRIVGEQQ